MAQMTHDPYSPLLPEDEADLVSRERLRSAIPVALAVTALFGMVLAAGLGLRELVDVGVWLVSAGS